MLWPRFRTISEQPRSAKIAESQRLTLSVWHPRNRSTAYGPLCSCALRFGFACVSSRRLTGIRERHVKIISVPPQGCAPLAQLDRASDYESEGREFESLRARHKINNLPQVPGCSTNRSVPWNVP